MVVVAAAAAAESAAEAEAEAGSANLATVMTASRAASTGFMSLMGLAVARLPASDAPARIWFDANQRSMCRIA